jgi:hypothetical protein
VISHPPIDMHRDAPGMADVAATLTQLMAQQVTMRTHSQVSQFFDGLELVDPGVVPIQQWHPDSEEEAQARAAMWGGVARKPSA